MKSKAHEVIVRVRFDQPISRQAAVQEFRNNFQGSFPTGEFSRTQYGTIKTVRSAGKKGFVKCLSE